MNFQKWSDDGRLIIWTIKREGLAYFAANALTFWPLMFCVRVAQGVSDGFDDVKATYASSKAGASPEPESKPAGPYCVDPAGGVQAPTSQASPAGTQSSHSSRPNG